MVEKIIEGITYISDLFLGRVRKSYPELQAKTSILCLCGNIGDPRSHLLWTFLMDCNMKFQRIYYVPGWFEFYTEEPSPCPTIQSLTFPTFFPPPTPLTSPRTSPLTSPLTSPNTSQTGSRKSYNKSSFDYGFNGEEDLNTIEQIEAYMLKRLRKFHRIIFMKQHFDIWDNRLFIGCLLGNWWNTSDAQYYAPMTDQHLYVCSSKEKRISPAWNNNWFMQQLLWITKMVAEEKELEVVLMTYGHPSSALFPKGNKELDTHPYASNIKEIAPKLANILFSSQQLTTWICGGCGTFPVVDVVKRNHQTFAINALGYFGAIHGKQKKPIQIISESPPPSL